jgi:hypothetical protein
MIALTRRTLCPTDGPAGLRHQQDRPGGGADSRVRCDCHWRYCPQSPVADVDASEVSGFLQRHPLDIVAVEEQHRDSYIIHLGELNMWVSVRSESPLFAELKRRHDQYLADHPDWNGWVAF